MKDSTLIDSYFYWLTSKNLSPKTISGYMERLGYLIRVAKERDMTLLELTERDIQKHFLELLKRVRPITINGRIKNWKLFYDYVERKGLSPVGWENPIKDIPKMKEAKRVWHIITPEEYSRMLKAYKVKTFQGMRNRALMLLAWDCMLRLSEILNLRIGDIRLKPDKTVRVLGKGNKERILSFSNKTAHVLIIYMNEHLEDIPGDYLFPTESGNRIDNRNGHRIFNNAAKKANLGYYNVGPHLIRRSAATHYWRKIDNIYLVKEILGHSDIRTTEIYVQASNSDIAAAYNKATPTDDIAI